MINIRDVSIRCGRCLNYMTLTTYATREGWNVYTYLCDTGSCDPDGGGTIVEVPTQIDEFARSHPDCGGGCSVR